MKGMSVCLLLSKILTDPKNEIGINHGYKFNHLIKMVSVLIS